MTEIPPLPMEPHTKILAQPRFFSVLHPIIKKYQQLVMPKKREEPEIPTTQLESADITEEDQAG